MYEIVFLRNLVLPSFLSDVTTDKNTEILLTLLFIDQACDIPCFTAVIDKFLQIP